jgi:hypothetical protein
LAIQNICRRISHKDIVDRKSGDKSVIRLMVDTSNGTVHGAGGGNISSGQVKRIKPAGTSYYNGFGQPT